MHPRLLLPWILLFLDTLLPRDTVGLEGVAAVSSGFCARSWVSCQKLHRSPCDHWPFFPLVTVTISSFNARQSLSILDHCPCFNSPAPGVKVSQSKFLIYAPLHQCFQFLINGSILSDESPCGTIPQHSFELRGLTYSQFAQIFQDIIGWNLRQ